VGPDSGGGVKGAGHHGAKNLRVGLPIKRKCAAKEDVEYNAAAPYVALLSILCAEDFRRNVVR
jgi:hypothetical protein